MNEEKFEFSGLPNYLEWYQCYDDLSSKEWIDGMELRSQRSSWDERTIAKWNFFYRPYRPVVGKPQKKRIGERQVNIRVCEDHIIQARQGITQQEECIRQAQSRLIGWSAVAAIGGAVLYFVAEYLVLAPVLAILIALSSFSKERSNALAKISDLKRTIGSRTAEIRKNQEEIRLLNEEINYLLGQIPRYPEASAIEQWLTEEVGEAELIGLSDFTGQIVTRENARDFISQDFCDPRVFGLLLDSWGFLQPVAQHGPLGRESTGLSRARDDLKRRVATWQIGAEGVPIFRLLFLQYIFPLAKNLNIYSFFYDFVNRRTYGKRFETFQYNHVTNYSIRELAAEEEPWASEVGLDPMTRILQDKVLKALTIAVSSGNHFRCVLVDEDIVDALNEWLKQEEKYKKLEDSLLSDAELREQFNGDERLIAAWKASEKVRIEEEMKQVVRERQQIQGRTARTARAMLTHVRNCVEEYVSRFQVPA